MCDHGGAFQSSLAETDVSSFIYFVKCTGLACFSNCQAHWQLREEACYVRVVNGRGKFGHTVYTTQSQVYSTNQKMTFRRQRDWRHCFQQTGFALIKWKKKKKRRSAAQSVAYCSFVYGANLSRSCSGDNSTITISPGDNSDQDNQRGWISPAKTQTAVPGSHLCIF